MYIQVWVTIPVLFPNQIYRGKKERKLLDRVTYVEKLSPKNNADINSSIGTQTYQSRVEESSGLYIMCSKNSLRSPGGQPKKALALPEFATRKV